MIKTLRIITIVILCLMLPVAIIGVIDAIRNPVPSYEELVSWEERSLADPGRFIDGFFPAEDDEEKSLYEAYLSSSTYEVLDTDYETEAELRVTVPDVSEFISQYRGGSEDLREQLMEFLHQPDRTKAAVVTIPIASDPDIYFVFFSSEELEDFVTTPMESYLEYMRNAD